MSKYMSSLIYMLEKTKGIQDMTELINHGFTPTTNMNIKITQNQQAII